MTRGFDCCLAVYTESSWELELGHLKKNSYLTSKFRTFQRLLYSRTVRISCDRQGRILIPEKFKNEVGIQKDVICVGLDQKFEIWDRKRWKVFNEENSDSFEKLAESLAEHSESSTLLKDDLSP